MDWVPRAVQADRAATDAELALVATDFAPAAGNDGPHALLGTLVDALDVRIPEHRAALLAATACMCLEIPDDEHRDPGTAFMGDKAPAADRAAIRAVLCTPLIPYAWPDWTPRVPILGRWVPTRPPEPVLIGPIAPSPGDTVFARLVPIGGTWHVRTAFCFGPVGPIGEWRDANDSIRAVAEALLGDRLAVATAAPSNDPRR